MISKRLEALIGGGAVAALTALYLIARWLG